MADGRSLSRGGTYARLAEPAWEDPLDTSYAKAAGGRWNPAGRYGALYLKATVEVARIQVRHKLAGHPYGPEDLDPVEQHDLVWVDVPVRDWLDCVTETGLEAVGLPKSYPTGPTGETVPWADCQGVGAQALADGRVGVACRSAATGAAVTDEELAVFETAIQMVTMRERVSFEQWWWGGAEAPSDDESVPT